MPDISFFIKIVSVVCQYGILLVLYYFLYQLLKLMYQDLAAKAIVKKTTAAREAVLSILDAADEGLQGRRYAFATGITIGRGHENDIVIEDAFVSHHHAVISQVNNLYILEDLKSVNHTYLNGSILQQKTALQNGDMIKIGLVTFKFER